MKSNNSNIKVDIISEMNNEYFGKNKSRNYLKHDYARVLEGLIQREVILRVVIECSEKRHFTKENKNKSGEVVGIVQGDFDPDNAGFLYTIFKNHELGVMVDLRQLLTKKEQGSGGKFILELTKVSVQDFLKFYKSSKKGVTIIPQLLLPMLIQNQKDGLKLTGNEFTDKYTDEIARVVEEIVKKAGAFIEKGYSELIVKDYEALKFHKDFQPDKFDVKVTPEKFGAISISKTTRKDKSKIDTITISNALNEFAEIIYLYQQLSSENTSFYSSSWPLNTFVKRTFELFKKDISAKNQQEVIDTILKHLRPTLNISGWSISSK